MRGSCRNQTQLDPLSVADQPVVLVVNLVGMVALNFVKRIILFMSTNVNILIVMQHTGGKAPKIFIQEICNISITTGEVKKVQQKLKKNPSCINTNKINMMEVQLCLNNQFLDHIRIV